MVFVPHRCFNLKPVAFDLMPPAVFSADRWRNENRRSVRPLSPDSRLISRLISHSEELATSSLAALNHSFEMDTDENR